MKLRNLLIVSALFLSASVAFAKPKNNTTSVSDFITMERDADTNTLNVRMFRMNNGWSYYVDGYTQGENGAVLTYRSTLSESNGTLVANTKTAIDAAIAKMDLPEDVASGLSQYAHSIYDFSIPVTDDIVEIGLAGGNGKGAFVESIWQRAATNGNDFWTIGEDGLIYMGKGNWIGQYNNGAMFLVGGSSETFGQPLPAPVVTLLIALALGGALVMYRSRKQQAEA